MSVGLRELAVYLDDYLRIHDFPDKSLNGLQVEGGDPVSRVALATDAALATFEQAHRGGAQLLVVHHGLFWGLAAPIVGTLRSRLRALLEAEIGLYCAHLPLDAHPEVGNNAVLARRLELAALRPFGGVGGATIGLGGELPRAMTAEELRSHCESRLGASVRLLPFGAQRAVSLAVVSGAAADLVEDAAGEGYDAYLTGETSHIAFHPAREAGVHLLFAGHYATETWGVRALGEHLSRRFDVETFFVDAPTGF